MDSGKNTKLVEASVYFLKVLSDTYGSQRALQFWDQLADTVDPDLKASTFSALLGSKNCGFKILGLPNYPNRMQIIQTIRKWDSRDLSLLEARSVYESYNTHEFIELHVYHEKIEPAKVEFTKLGCICN